MAWTELWFTGMQYVCILQTLPRLSQTHSMSDSRADINHYDNDRKSIRNDVSGVGSHNGIAHDDDNNNSDTSPDSSENEQTHDPKENGPELNNKRIILQRFTIYNSLSTMYIVGSNAKESLFRIIEISSSDNSTSLNIIEDKNYFYTRKDMVELINGLNDTIEGGIHKIAQAFGLIGLIKFTRGYYLSVITKCSQVAIIGGHFVYHIDETKLIPLDLNYKRPDKYSDEEKLLTIFKYLDLGKTFYFSYTYDVTNSLQTNFMRHKRAAMESSKLEQEAVHENFEHNERFVWNNLLLRPVLSQSDIATYEWFQPIIHGFIDQANISIYGRKIYITIIARRSHHFAGARFLKRGVNDRGNVANEVETEQIVSDMLTTSFHHPKFGFYSNPRYTSFVQHRGSIPLYWTQDLNRLPKPPIEINLFDPFYQSSAMHFNDLMSRYGTPIFILNLIKTKEKQPRELKLNQHFENCITYLNQFLPPEVKLRYHSFDMSKHSKKNMDVIGPLQNIARLSIKETGFFHNGIDYASTKIQRGIMRTNCIDCLDRTNAAQFIICKEALSHQVRSLGFLSPSAELDYDSDLMNILTEIFHDHGDTIAVQYGGSNLVNTMDSYRRINQWSSHTRDILNSIKRIYSNSFMDLIRQEAINLFLGNYVYDPDKPKLWELQNDYYLHNNNQIQNFRTKPSYQRWYNMHILKKDRDKLLCEPEPHTYSLSKIQYLAPFPEYNDNWFNECYVPRKFQSFSEIFQFNMNSNLRYFPSNSNLTPKDFDYSPFKTRKPYFKNRSLESKNQLTGNGSESKSSRARAQYIIESRGELHHQEENKDPLNNISLQESYKTREVSSFNKHDNSGGLRIPLYTKNLDGSSGILQRSYLQNDSISFGISENNVFIYENYFRPDFIPLVSNIHEGNEARRDVSVNNINHKVYEYSTSIKFTSSQLLSQEPSFLTTPDIKCYWMYVDGYKNESSTLSTEDDYFM